MINEFAKTRYGLLLEELEAFNEMGITDAQRSKGKLTAVRNALTDLIAAIGKDSFPGAEDEIEFFKVWKPLFLAHYVFEQDCYKLKVSTPLIDHEETLQFYREELLYLDRFNTKHQFMLSYYLSESTELDHLYFLRNGTPVNLLWMDACLLEGAFSTAGEGIFAKFKSNEWLRAFILEAIADLQSPPAAEHLPADPELKWTGDAVNLVELAYGLWLTGQFNHGSAGLNQIVRWLEINWATTVGIPQKRFAEISARKTISQTRYIDLMKERILQKIDAGHA